MSGSEIDIVQDKTKEAVRSYRTVQATKKSPDRIVQYKPPRSHQIVSYMGYGVRELEEKKRGSPTYLRSDVVRS